MADPLYLSIWFPQFDAASILPRLLSVMRPFPFSGERPGVEYISIHPVSWSESTVLERRFRPGIAPELAVAMAGEFIHSDYAYVFEAYWDLWTPEEVGSPEIVSDKPPEDRTYASASEAFAEEIWSLEPSLVRFLAHGPEFDEAVFQQAGHVQVDFGLDAPFLHEELELTSEAEARVRANVQKLVNFTTAVEKNCGISGRLLWSESEENLAQKLVARLQDVQ